MIAPTAASAAWTIDESASRSRARREPDDRPSSAATTLVNAHGSGPAWLASNVVDAAEGDALRASHSPDGNASRRTIAARALAVATRPRPFQRAPRRASIAPAAIA